jgi:hypothetical protein
MRTGLTVMWRHDYHHFMSQNAHVIDKRREVAFSDTPTLCNLILTFYRVTRERT